MRALWDTEIPEACDSTLLIAERVTSYADVWTPRDRMPVFPVPEGQTQASWLRHEVDAGLAQRFPAGVPSEYVERAAYEINVICDKGYPSYFLIVADLINYARSVNIRVGPGRGSAAGSLVAYALRITDIDPIEHGLLFERFLNPERVSPPDVDIDFCQSRRTEVIAYVRKKYGERSVSHIITYGKLGAKSVLRDVCRVMGISYGEGDRIAKMIEAKPDTKLQAEYEAKPELKELIESSSTYQQLWSYATKLEGLARNVGVHAAGVVIGDRPLDEHVPLTRGNEGEVVTQYDMKAITDVGLLKMDFLGLKNLTVIHEAVQNIRKHTPEFSIESVSLEDWKTFELLNRGETMGVFQLESGGMVETCRKYAIEKIDDIIDLLAVYRPGAMQFIDQMLDVKKGRARAMYEHPLLEQVCGDTFGVMIYQEQVQNAAKVLAGYSLGGADLLRRAMGKKDPVEMEKQRAKFVEGAEKTNNIGKKLADQIFDKIAMFAGYGFNKSHSACYGHISYWTAYLKANHSVEFMAALLSNEIHNTDKIGVFVSECHRMGLEILPPNLNASHLRFSPEVTPNGAKGVRYGLAAIKNCGEGAMAIAIEEREKNGSFTSLDDFASRLDSKVVNKRILENLVKAGALDWTNDTRAGMFARLEQVVASASSAQRDRASGQVSMFDSMDFASPAAKSKSKRSSEPTIEEWSKDERLTHEKELLGFYVTGHPLDKFRKVIDSNKYRRLGLMDDLDLSNPRERFPFAGMVRSLDAKTTKTGKPFGVLVLEDFTGSSEIMLWGETFVPARDAGLLEPGKIIRLKGNIQVDERTGGRRITGYELAELKPKRTAANQNGPLELTLWTTRHSDRDLLEIKLALTQHPGPTPVLLHFQNSAGRRVTVAAGENFQVQRSDDLEEALGRWLEE
jgi:DNA polymerase-3 subunit alpha